MAVFHDDVLINITPIITDRLYFISILSDDKVRNKATVYYFNVDETLVYDGYANDFGPLNICMLYQYCKMVDKKLELTSLKNKKIVHYTTSDEQSRANSAFLIGSYAVLYLRFTPECVMDLLNKYNSVPYIGFRDASVMDTFEITIENCISAVYKARKLGLFNFADFNYSHYENCVNVDLNVIVPGKLIGFCGPYNKAEIDNGHMIRSPEMYIHSLRELRVKTIVRLNEKMYDAKKFTKAGFKHYDLYFEDGTTPSDAIVDKFLAICEENTGAIAVHCKAGIGRTGTLIACYIMKHYKFSAREAIAWVRLCRPGSVIGIQQTWLESKETRLWKAGDKYRGGCEPKVHVAGIYSYGLRNAEKVNKIPPRTNVSCILKRVDTMRINEKVVVPNIDEIRPHIPKKRPTRPQKVLQNITLNAPKTSGSALNSSLGVGTAKAGIKGRVSTSKNVTKRNYTAKKQTSKFNNKRKTTDPVDKTGPTPKKKKLIVTVKAVIKPIVQGRKKNTNIKTKVQEEKENLNVKAIVPKETAQNIGAGKSYDATIANISYNLATADTSYEPAAAGTSYDPAAAGTSYDPVPNSKSPKPCTEIEDLITTIMELKYEKRESSN